MAFKALYREDCLKVVPNQKQIASISPMTKFHPIAECLPMLPGQELDQLVEDVRKYGLRVPITVFENKILDGRNRYVACKKAKVKPRFEPYEGDDPVSFVMRSQFCSSSSNCESKSSIRSQNHCCWRDLGIQGASRKRVPRHIY
jgi:hypothetical protein